MTNPALLATVFLLGVIIGVVNKIRVQYGVTWREAAEFAAKKFFNL